MWASGGVGASQRMRRRPLISDPHAGLSEASRLQVWGTRRVLQGPHPQLTGAAHSVSVGAQQASSLSMFRARTCSVLLGHGCPPSWFRICSRASGRLRWEWERGWARGPREDWRRQRAELGGVYVPAHPSPSTHSRTLPAWVEATPR